MVPKTTTSMNNSLTTTTASQQISLLDIRKDPRSYPRLGTYSREQAVAEMTKIVAQAVLYRGQNADENNIAFTASSLVDELLADDAGIGSRNISFAEISRVVKKAVLHEDLFGVSVATLYKVIADYIKGEGHRLQLEVNRTRQAQREKEMKNSIIAPMLQTFAGSLLKNSK